MIENIGKRGLESKRPLPIPGRRFALPLNVLPALEIKFPYSSR